MLKKSLLALLPLAILAGGWYFVQTKNTGLTSTLLPDTGSTPSRNSNPADNQPDNPLAPKKNDATLIVDSIEADEKRIASSQSDLSDNSDLSYELSVDSELDASSNVEPSSVAVEPLSDAEYIRLEQLLKNDKNLRLSLLEEFRYNTDSVRAKQLAALLGPYDDPEIIQIASELAYSGDRQSRIAGLDLLSRVQPRNDEARDIAINLLNAGDNPKMLVATMNVLATPSRNATDSQLQALNDNLNNLSNHYDPAVRAQSMSLLGRWDKNSTVARDAFSRGLTDPDPNVRSSATFAINNISNPDNSMISGLLSIAENTDENRSTRYAAIRALGNVQLSGTLNRRYIEAKRSANRR